ncbi:F-box/FBD/LRR-repeat protein At3g52680, partial [Linum perenne]
VTMKRARLSGGQSREADRISELPDEIIHEILERLQCPEEAAKSSLLSRRWVHIWRSYPIIEFHGPEDYSYSAKLQLFVAAAAKKLSSDDEHNRIKAVRISSRCSAFNRDLVDLIVNREPEEIVVEGYYRSQFTPLLATNLINNPKLRILDLCDCKFWEYQDTNHLDMRMINLRVLRLERFSIDDKLLNRLIAGSPLLEELKLSHPEYPISRLHICNNPNLKILDLGKCIVWELIQIAGTTKSLETMSLTSSDLDISPSALSSLKSLKMDKAYKLMKKGINNLIAYSSSLQSLCLSHIKKVKEVKIRSDSLLQLKLDDLNPDMRLHIDAPRLVDVYYTGNIMSLPTVTRPVNLQQAQLCTFTLHLRTRQINHFIELKDFLVKLRRQFRSVRICLDPCVSFLGDVVDYDHASLIPMIEQVEFKFDLSKVDDKHSLMNALFWSFHPEYLCLMRYNEPSLEYMAESFINRRNNDSCCKSGYKCWRHQLKDVKIVIRKEDEAVTMKRARLSGGRSREADRISELPDEIIHEILERLQSPMEAAKSILLSRRWIHIWRSYPILEFHGPKDYSYSEKLMLFVTAAAKKLSSSEHNRIKAVRISSGYSDFIRDVLDLIVNREPEEIVVKGHWNLLYQLFPTQLINNPRLRILDLLSCKFWEYQDTNDLDMRMINLRVLHLEYFSIDELLLNRLIAASPLLEELKLRYPLETIRKLHICNNPNLKILQLEHCGVEEIIQIAGTTKSLEVMSLNCSDLDISPSALSNLKSLKIHYACQLTGEFISNLIANSPSLQSLCLSYIGEIEELKIRSDTLQKLKLDVVHVNLGIHIDAPRLVHVHHHGSLHWLPAITRPANLRKAQLCNSITLSLYSFNELIEMNDFIKLKDFLVKLRQQFRSVQLRFNFWSSSFPFYRDVVACDHGSLIPMIEHVDTSSMDGKDGFIDALFWSCHPKYLCEESYQGCSSLKYVANSFINRGNSDNCCKSGYECWRHQLKDVKIVIRKEDEVLDSNFTSVKELPATGKK